MLTQKTASGNGILSFFQKKNKTYTCGNLTNYTAQQKFLTSFKQHDFVSTYLFNKQENGINKK